MENVIGRESLRLSELTEPYVCHLYWRYPLNFKIRVIFNQNGKKNCTVEASSVALGNTTFCVVQ